MATHVSEEEPLALFAARALQTLVSHPQVARTLAIGIQSEAAWRSVVETQLRAVGLRSNDQRRRHRERLESPAGLADRGRERVLVNWHEGGTGPALLLLNGWTASGLVWPVSWLDALEQQFRVIRIDNRGTGWSRSAPAPYTLANLADDAAAVLRACDVDQATVLGVSMGGMIAQELALRHPDRVRHLLLVSTAPPVPAQIVPDPAPYLAALARPAPGQHLELYMRALWSRYTTPAFAAAHPEVIDEIAAQIVCRVTPRQRVFDQLRAIRSWHGSDRLRRIHVPTTIVHGDQDPLMPVGNGMRLSRLIPKAEYVELEGVGHLPAYEAGAELLKVIGG
jgi:pimeloyl-ACP methyl ester carboxylesterase